MVRVFDCSRSLAGSTIGRVRINGLLACALVASGLNWAASAGAARGHLRYSPTPLAHAPSTPCPPAAEPEQVECELITDPSQHTTGEPEYEGSGEKGGLDPEDLRSAYNLPGKGGSGQTIALVETYDYPTAESDLATYRKRYGLPECTQANGCFRKVNQKGETKHYPEIGGGGESALDMDMVSAACSECHILLIEAESDSWASYETAENEAITLGATAVSNSYNFGFEGPGAKEVDAQQEAQADPNFDHPGVPIFFSGGDYGYAVRYPAGSRYVIAVGGTRLKRAPETPRGWTETTWSNPEEYPGVREKGRGSGSGCSLYEPKPVWQAGAQFAPCPRRMEEDVAADADWVHSPVSSFDSEYYEGGWGTNGGTSASAPFLAGVAGLDSGFVRQYGAEALYRTGNWFDVTEGTVGVCTPPEEDAFFCAAGLGYDGPTGIGSPDGVDEVSSYTAQAITGSATDVGEATATLGGVLSSGSKEGEYWFEYGPTTSYGSSSSASKLSAAGPDSEVSKSIAGLSRATTYHYRVVLHESTGTIYGNDASFTSATGVWSLESGVQPTGNRGSRLRGQACGTPSACVAVGEVEDAEGATGLLAETWNGTAWTVTSPTPPVEARESRLEAVACASSSECMAVGYYVNWQNVNQPLAYSWNGTEWKTLQPKLPSRAVGGALHGVACPAAEDCEAVGEYQNAAEELASLADAWAGGKWSTEAVGTTSHAINTLRSVSCPTTTACVAVGWDRTAGQNAEPLVYVRSGSTWSAEVFEGPRHAKDVQPNGVSCLTATNCTLVGWYISSAKEELALAARYVWGTWTLAGVPSPTGAKASQLNQVTCQIGGEELTECFGVGSYLDSEEQQESLFEHWTGKTSEWTLTSGPSLPPGGVSAQLAGLACTSITSCDVDGVYSTAEGAAAPLAASWNAGVWSSQTPPSLLGVQGAILYRDACTSVAACTAVGQYGDSAEEWQAVAEAWNGVGWHTEAALTPSAEESFLQGLSCPSESDCEATGGYITSAGAELPLAELWNGSAWTLQTPALPAHAKAAVLHVVSCSSSTSCEAVGGYVNKSEEGVALAEHWDGKRWTTEKLPLPKGITESLLKGVSCPTTTSCWADGWVALPEGGEEEAPPTEPLLEHWNGSTWTQETPPNPGGPTAASHLSGISCASASTCMANGWSSPAGAEEPFAEHLAGGVWSAELPPEPAAARFGFLDGVSCPTETSCVASGAYVNRATHTTETLVDRWSGSEWLTQSTENVAGAKTTTLQGMACSSPNACLATGYAFTGEKRYLALAETPK